MPSRACSNYCSHTWRVSVSNPSLTGDSSCLSIISPDSLVMSSARAGPCLPSIETAPKCPAQRLWHKGQKPPQTSTDYIVGMPTVPVIAQTQPPSPDHLCPHLHLAPSCLHNCLVQILLFQHQIIHQHSQDKVCISHWDVHTY